MSAVCEKPRRPVMRYHGRARHWPKGIVPNLRYTVDANGCWAWQGAVNEAGYGIIGTNRHGTFRAHRVAFELYVRELKDLEQLDHICRNRACINPAHLRPVSNAENSRCGVKAKLTMEIARSIRAEYARGGTSFRKLANKWRVSSCAISNIINNKRWTEVEQPRGAA